ncbi:hypothetical protein GCM10008938_52420 [Deinococcus roseus]|uniref:Transposase n=1 Tax=Deinococcus roseus TaxID=392414 RepID=A0ABQ2DM19_9DEIO|nr:hypothetical protein GCM10008938_52420 [Deinococcus roseus]
MGCCPVHAEVHSKTPMDSISVRNGNLLQTTVPLKDRIDWGNLDLVVNSLLINPENS